MCGIVGYIGSDRAGNIMMDGLKRLEYRGDDSSGMVGSTIARESDGGIYQHAGPEIGVASTKAFTSQIMICAMLALYLGRLRDLSYADGVEILKALKKVPEQVEEVLK
jgi:glucosamine--fructose-6-phosphate aminotransferase (isomerizing)